jgi:flagellar hook-basal body complex protein FliE
MSIDPVQFTLPAFEAPLLKGSVSHNEKEAPSFANSLTKAMNNLRDVHNKSNALVEEYAAGGSVDVSEVMIAMEKTAMATELALQIRNRIVEGYQEIIKMQI